MAENKRDKWEFWMLIYEGKEIEWRVLFPSNASSRIKKEQCRVVLHSRRVMTTLQVLSCRTTDKRSCWFFISHTPCTLVQFLIINCLSQPLLIFETLVKPKPLQINEINVCAQFSFFPTSLLSYTDPKRTLLPGIFV